MKVLKDKNVLLLMLTYGQILGIFNTLGSIIGAISNDCGYTIAQGSSFGSLFVVGGILGCIPFTIWVEKKQAYKAAITTIATMSTLLVLIQIFVFPSKSNGAVLGLMFL